MDEAGIMEGLGENGLVVGSSEKRSIQKKTPGSRVWTSLIECVSATGRALPPLVIFKGKSVQQQWFPQDLSHFKDWQFTATKNGWTSDQTAVEWLEKVFIPRTQPCNATERRLLVLDGHGSHESVDFMYLCYQHKIHLLYLPPHTSHVLQPLDLSVFSPLKHFYRKEVGFLSLLTDSSPIGKQNFLFCYQKAREQALAASNIKGGWKASGLWPVSMAKPLLSRLLLENSNKGKNNAKNAADVLKTPSSITTWMSEASQVAWSTPRKSKDLKVQVLHFSQLESDVPTKRLLFRKITKGFDEKDSLLAKAQLQIQALEAQLEAARPKRRRKVETSPNSRFADIKAIQRAEEEVAVAESNKDDEEESEVSDKEESCIIVHID
jgi:4-hydroxybenzoate polyprenyltransferase